MTDLKIVSSGIDWLTTTAVDGMTAKLLLREAESIAREESKRGFYLKPWKQSGYTGFACGRIQHGERADSAIVRLTSDLADSEWWRCYQITERATRVDVQITFVPECGPNRFIHRVHRELQRHYKTWKKHPRITMWSTSDGGLTLYLGARSSAVYFRCYNKEIESADVEFAGCVRAEIEFKDCAVTPLMSFLFANLPTREFACKVVSSFAGEHGISSFPITVNPPSYYEGQPSATDELKSLKWLATQVKPSVLELVRRGRIVDVLDNLGLSEYVVVCPNTKH